jgi:tRNA pseudouridine13 synthase
VRLRQLLRDNWRDWETCAGIARGPMYAAIFGRLMQDPHDFVGALDVVPTRLKLIHLFSYQSWLWNRAVSLWLQRKLRSREQVRLRTLSGRLVCWRYLTDEGRAALADKAQPLIAHDTEYADAEFGQAMADVLLEEDLTQRQLGLLRVAGFRLREEPRTIVLRPEDLEVNEPRADERNPGRLKVELRFKLPRGAYATLVVKRLFTEPVRYGDDDEAEGQRPARRERGGGRFAGRPSRPPGRGGYRWRPPAESRPHREFGGPRRPPPQRPALRPAARPQVASPPPPPLPAPQPQQPVAKPAPEVTNWAQEVGATRRPRRRTSVLRRLLRDQGDAKGSEPQTKG